MIVLIDQQHTASATAHYAIVRRNGAVVPFEPREVAVAMMKAFLAIRGTLDVAPTRHPFASLVRTLSSRVSQWSRHLRLQTSLFKVAGDERPSAQRRSNDGLRVAAGSGFFSAAKPNLRNAP